MKKRLKFSSWLFIQQKRIVLCDYFRNNWPEIITLFITVLAGSFLAFIAIFWQVNKETMILYRRERQNFRNTLQCVNIEGIKNRNRLKKIMSDLKVGRLEDITLIKNNAEVLIANPLSFKYIGSEYIYILSQYIDDIETSIKWLNHLKQKEEKEEKVNIDIPMNELKRAYNHTCLFLEINMRYVIALTDRDTLSIEVTNTDKVIDWVDNLTRSPEVSIASYDNLVKNKETQEKIRKDYSRIYYIQPASATLASKTSEGVL